MTSRPTEKDKSYLNDDNDAYRIGGKDERYLIYDNNAKRVG